MPLSKRERRIKIKSRIRRKLYGTADKPRFSVYRSNKQIYAQFIDDDSGKTLFGVSSLEKEILDKKDVSKKEQARMVGELAAKTAKEKGVENVVFDRNGYLYHGRVQSLADAAREGGLKF
ncbi:MAG: 50S ribosomal protein L18 [Bacteroidetes bacterium]|jgi:large subunit ribosomal protein L18|nr:50S ribosomal protein L18 [Bacteroidota bacterium]